MNFGDPIYGFVFKGLLTDQALENTQCLKKAIFSIQDESNIYETLGIQDMDEEVILTARKMSYVYTAICAFENTVRKFVTSVLSESKGEKWWEVCVSEKIKNKAESRREEEMKIRWHTPRGDTIINYTEFGDLITIMRNNWTEFEPFVVSLEWAEMIIKTIERSRNVIMHSGELVTQDIERIGMNIRDWLRQVGT